MAGIDDIAALIGNNIKAAEPTFKGTPIADARYQASLATLFLVDRFQIQGATVTSEDDKITVRGKAGLFDLVDVPVNIGYRLRRGRLFFFTTLEVAGPALLAALSHFGSPLKDTGFTWEFGPLAASDDVTALSALSFYRFDTVIEPSGGLRLPLTIVPGTAKATWSLRSNFDAIALGDLGAMVKWFAAGRTVPELPAGLAQLPGLQLCGLGVDFDAEQGQIDAASLSVATATSWLLLKDRLELSRVSLALGYTASGASSSLAVRLDALFDLAGHAVPVSLALANGHLRLAMQADDGLPLPGLAALAKLAGHAAWADALPKPVVALSELILRTLSIELDLNAGELTRLGARVGSAQPVGPIQGLTLDDTELDLTIAPEATPPLSADLRALAAAGDDYLALFGRIDKELSLSGSIDALPLTALATKFVPDLPDALGDLQLTGVNLQLDSAGQIDFSASVTWDLHTALAALKLPPLPDGFTTIELSSLAFTADAAAKTWQITLTPAGEFVFPANGAGPAVIGVSQISLTLANDGLSCTFTLDGQAKVSDALGLAAKQIRCDARSGSGDWHFGGDLTVELLGHAYPFTPRIDIDAQSASFVLGMQGQLALSPWPDHAAVTADKLQIGVRKSDADTGYRWNLRGAAHIDIANGTVVADGGLALANGALNLTAEVKQQPQIELSAIPGEPHIDLNLEPLKLTLGGPTKRSLSAGARVAVKGMPVPADSVFPDGESSGGLVIDDKGLAIRFAPLGEPTLEIAFLGIHLPDITIDALVLQKHKASEGNSPWKFGAELTVAGLAQLNKLFSNADLFNDSAKLLMSVGKGLSLTLNGPSPLKPVKLRPPDDEGALWTEWLTIRDTGSFSFRVPEFAFDFAGGRWKASGGVESQDDLTLPLGLIKDALKPVGLDKLLAAMPDRLPLAELDLNNKALYPQIEKMLGGLSGAAADTFKLLADWLQKGVERLPTAMHDYLKISIPRSLTFDMSVEPTGGYAFGLRTQGEPLRLLLPWLTLLGPGLLGITAHRLSVGLSGGGSVAVVKADAWFDQFDALGLIYALSTGKGEALINRFELRETTALLPTAAPFPVPLFYEKFGWTYHDFLGLRAQALAGFGPTEEPPLGDWLKLIGLLVDFFSKPDWYLHKHDIPASMQLPFTLDGAFLALPEYLGGSQLGRDTPMPTLPVATTLATALDGIKAGNIGWIIQSVPLRYPNKPGGDWIRVGNEAIVFGPLEIDAAWCISTQDEFQNTILKYADALAMLDAANAGQMLTCLPQHYGGASYDKGYVILLMGGLKVGSPIGQLFHFTCQFGMAAMGPRDFETALRLVGGFGPHGMLELGIEGRIKTNVPPDHPDATHVHVDGCIWLSVLQQRFELGGHIDVISGLSFSAGIDVGLTSALHLGGELTVTQSATTISGTLTLAGAGFTTSATFDKEGVSFDAITLDVGGLSALAGLRFPGRDGAPLSLWAGVALPASFMDDFIKSLVHTADAEVTPAINDAYDQFETWAAKIGTFEASLNGLKEWLPGFCSKIIGIIEKRTTDAAITKAMWAWSNDSSSWWTRQGRKAAVRSALTFGSPGKTARESAAPWIAKLKAVRDAASKPVDQQYKAGLQKALDDLTAHNTIVVKVGVGSVKFTAYEQKAVLTPDQIKEIRTGRDLIGKLPEASKHRAHFQQILDQAPREKLLAQVRKDIKDGMQAMPSVESVGFEASNGFDPAKIDLIIAVNYRNRKTAIDIPADLTQPAALPAAVGAAFADAFSK